MSLPGCPGRCECNPTNRSGPQVCNDKFSEEMKGLKQEVTSAATKAGVEAAKKAVTAAAASQQTSQQKTATICPHSFATSPSLLRLLPLRGSPFKEGLPQTAAPTGHTPFQPGGGPKMMAPAIKCQRCRQIGHHATRCQAGPPN